MKYKIVISVTGLYETEVVADSEDEALDIAEERYSEADSGEFEIYDGNIISVNNEIVE